MADRYAFTIGELRFFSPDQADKILCDGAKRGRTGSHAAIERILKVEPGLPRVRLWRRLRELKDPSRGESNARSVWSADDDAILKKGYEKSWSGKRTAVRELLRRHPRWRPHTIWKRAARLNLTLKTSKRGQERRRQRWSEHDESLLLGLAGYKPVEKIAKLLHRSVDAVRSRLLELGKSTRFQREGYSHRAISKDLHLAAETIRRLIAQGWLEVRDPRITRESLRNLRTLRKAASPLDEPALPVNSVPDSQGSPETGGATDHPSAPLSQQRPGRAARVWSETAKELGVEIQTIKDYVAQGVLKLYDPRITEASLRHLCRRNGWIIDDKFLAPDTRYWLQSSMDFVPGQDEPLAKRLASCRKHAQIVRTCKQCNRKIRGNSFFRHQKLCDQKSKHRAGGGIPGSQSSSGSNGGRHASV